MTVYNLFFVYRDGDSYLTASFIATYATLDTATIAASQDTTRKTRSPRCQIHVDTHDGRIGSEWVESNTRCTDGDYLILATSVQGA